MTAGLLVLVAIVFIGVLVYNDRANQRMKEEREAHRQEVNALLNRIQSPDLASYQPEPVKSTGQHHLPWDDDEAWHKWQEAMKPMEQM